MINPVAVLIGVVVVVMFAMSLLVAGFAEIPEFVAKPSLTDWMQALGTIGAAGVALRAYNVWRVQERKKREADAAEKVLHAAHATAGAIKNARLVLPLTGLAEENFIATGAMMVTIGSREATVRACERVSAELEGHEALAETYLPREVLLRMSSLAFVGSRVSWAFRDLQAERDQPDPVKRNRLWNRSPAELVESLGVLGVHDNPDAYSGLREDALALQIADDLRELKRLLAPFMRYEV